MPVAPTTSPIADQSAQHTAGTVLNLYRKLHNGLSDMIEDGRLKEADIPDDYKWLVESLAHLAFLDPEPDAAVPADPGSLLNGPDVWPTHHNTPAHLASDVSGSEALVDAAREVVTGGTARFRFIGDIGLPVEVLFAFAPAHVEGEAEVLPHIEGHMKAGKFRIYTFHHGVDKDRDTANVANALAPFLGSSFVRLVPKGGSRA
jgi:hypothetical protein